MKTMKPKMLMLSALFFAPLAIAAEKHDHDHGSESKDEHDDHAKKGPNGGHVVASKAGSFEITVDKERKARIVFLDKELKAVALEAQSINGVAGERSNPVKIAFAKGKDADANVLISDHALPAGDHVPIVLVIKTSPEAKATTERFELHLH